jgi:phosphoesterase RecJ-like protein
VGRIETTPGTGESIPAIVAVLARARRVLVTMHRYPDGDALGSALGLARALREWGKEAVVYSADPVPPVFAFLPGAGEVVDRVGPAERFDVTVSCDAGDLHRLGPDFPGPDRRGVLVNLDHHVSTPHFGDLNLLDPRAASVGVLVHRLLAAAGRPPSRETALALYVSLVTDTGSFRYANTGPEAHRLAAALLETGIDPWEVASRIYESNPPERLRLLSRVLETLAVECDGRLASIEVTRRMREETGTEEEVEGGFVTYPRSIAGVEVSICFREVEDGRVRVSLRSRGATDVSAIAARFGGGGHRQAAGCAITGSLPEVRERVLAVARASLARHP